MKLSSKTKYGLRSCFLLARCYGEKPVSASVLEKTLNVSGKYLEQIMRKLSKENIVSALRGANGGYYLAKPPREVSIGDIVRCLEEEMELVDCLKTDSECKCCPSKWVWTKLYESINSVLDGMNLEHMLNGEIGNLS